MDWKRMADEAGLVVDGRIAGLDVVRETTAGTMDVIMCPAAEVQRRIASRRSSGIVREPTPERIYVGRALSVDPVVGAAMIVRAVIGRWTVLRQWYAVHDEHEAVVIRTVEPFLREAGVVLADIARNVRQIPSERIVAPVKHDGPLDAASKALGQFVRQVDGRTVIVFAPDRTRASATV